MEFKVISGGVSGDQWVARFKGHLWWEAREMLQSKNFVATTGITYRCVVVKGSEFDHDPSTEEVMAEGKKRGYSSPPPEVAPLLREFISDGELELHGLWWLAVMHESLVSNDEPQLFVIHRYHTRGLASWSGVPSTLWFRDGGFIFIC